jgi:hypothetical protein
VDVAETLMIVVVKSAVVMLGVIVVGVLVFSIRPTKTA